MRVRILAAALCLLCPCLGLAQEALDLSRYGPLIRKAERDLRDNPAAVDIVAERIERSSLVDRITGAGDRGQRLREIRRWIQDHTSQAAQIAVGLARDDAEQNDEFESALRQSFVKGGSKFEENPEAVRNVFTRLKKSSRDATLLKNDDLMKDEERGEIIKTLFEGEGGMSDKILTFGGGPAEDKGSVSSLEGGIYDRLNHGNLTGYSPHILSIQSALNARRVPGAPRLAETGRLDYQTLNDPAHQLRYDLANLERRLLYERNYALAKALGRLKDLKPADLAREDVGKRLVAEAAGKTQLDQGLLKRLTVLERVRRVLLDFEKTALRSKNPSGITAALLRALGSKQKEAARWLTIASLEEELAMIEAEEGFYSDDLLKAIAACPVEEDAKTAYKRRGQGFKSRLGALKANDEAAIKALEAPDWAKSIGRVTALLAKNADLRKDLSRGIRDYVDTPFRLAASLRPKPRWRAYLDRLILRFLPSSEYGVRLRKEEADLERFKDVFIKIATGDIDAAHQILRGT